MRKQYIAFQLNTILCNSSATVSQRPRYGLWIRLQDETWGLLFPERKLGVAKWNKYGHCQIKMEKNISSILFFHPLIQTRPNLFHSFCCQQKEIIKNIRNYLRAEVSCCLKSWNVFLDLYFYFLSLQWTLQGLQGDKAVRKLTGIVISQSISWAYNSFCWVFDEFTD